MEFASRSQRCADARILPAARNAIDSGGQGLVVEGDIPPDVDQVLNKPPKLRELREALAGCLQFRKS
jgi:hypothetical protein